MRDLSARRTLIVMKREFFQRVYSRSFLISTLFVPLLLVAIVLIPALLMPHTGTHPAAQQGLPVSVARAGAILAAVVLLYVLFMSLFTYGAIVMRSVLDEKQSRVLEVLLCFTSPEELMAGKLLGVGALAMAQVLLWMLLGGAILLVSPAARALVAAMQLGAGALVGFLIFELLGYLFYSAMFCAIGAAFNSTDEAQQWTIILVLPLIVTGMLLSSVLSAPDSGLSIVASIVPFTSPALMYTRILIGHPPLSQIALAVAVLVLSVAIAVSICARIYRVGILMYGKRPTAREILRWLRYA
jgi:ABC-2 type transport system permease protein